MAFTSSIEITLSKAESIGKVLPLLHSAGWRFWEDEVRYCWFVEVGDEEIAAAAAPERWPELVSAWDEQCRLGRTVEIMYQWQNSANHLATVWFSHEQMGNTPLLKIQFLMFPAWQRLCGNITDYSWYLSRIVCPLEQNDCGVLWFTCGDDNS